MCSAKHFRKVCVNHLYAFGTALGTRVTLLRSVTLLIRKLLFQTIFRLRCWSKAFIHSAAIKTRHLAFCYTLVDLGQFSKFFFGWISKESLYIDAMKIFHLILNLAVNKIAPSSSGGILHGVWPPSNWLICVTSWLQAAMQWDDISELN